MVSKSIYSKKGVVDRDLLIKILLWAIFFLAMVYGTNYLVNILKEFYH